MWLLVYLASSFARHNTRSRMFATVNVGDPTISIIFSSCSLVDTYMATASSNLPRMAQMMIDDPLCASTGSVTLHLSHIVDLTDTPHIIQSKY